MEPLDLELPPGFVRSTTPKVAKGRYSNGDKIRFQSGVPEKWAGWQRLIPTALRGVPRGATSWANVFGTTNISIGTHLKLYVIKGGDSLVDITPIRASSTINNNPFTTTNGSATVTVTDTAHGAEQNDFVTYSGATAVGGITIVGEYQITRKIDNNSYEIVHTSVATSGATGGGASVVAAYQTITGNQGTIVGLGWGAATWGTGTWGTPRTDGIEIELRHWSVHSYGNDLIANPSGDSIFLWEEATDTRAELVTNAPTSVRAMFVTGERYIFALGTSTPLTIEWPDVDDITDWTPSASNTANTRTLQSGSKIMAGTALAQSLNLVWTDTSLYLFQYTGSDFVYDSPVIGESCGLAGPLAFTTNSGTAYWISSHDFHMSTGSAPQPIPNAVDVHDLVFAEMDKAQITKAWCTYDEAYNQVRWGYCSMGAIEPDRYVDVCLDDYSWTTGTLDRTTACKFRPNNPTLILADADGFVYEHNVGLDADGAPLDWSLTYGEYEVGKGRNNVDIMGIVTNFQRHVGAIDVEVFTKEYPDSAAIFDTETKSIAPHTAIEDLRVAGRVFSMTMSQTGVLAGDFRGGIPALEIQAQGERR